MLPLVAATFAGRTEDGVRFTFGNGWECRIYVLDHDLVRVLFTGPDGLHEPRTWMVAPNGVDVPWEGRDRLDVGAFPRPSFALEVGSAEVSLQTDALRVRVRLNLFGLQWSQPGGKPFAEDRPTQAYQRSASSGVVRHYMARERSD